MANSTQSKEADQPLRIKRETKTLRQLALDRMRDAIMQFHFQPGERLVERNLCEQLGVSRSVVREVLSHLEAEGLVETIPNQGPAVAHFDPGKVVQMYEIRAILEAMAAEACARHGDERLDRRLRATIDHIDDAFESGDPLSVIQRTTEFYEALFSYGDKPVAWKIVKSLNARINHLRAMTISSPERHHAAIGEMLAIVDAIEARDPEAAGAAAREHIRIVAEIADGYLNEQHAGS